MRMRYKKLFAIVALLTVGYVAQAQSFFTASFSTAQQTDAVTSDATGTAALVLTDEGLRYIISVEGLTGPITNAHIHAGQIGTSGGVVRSLLPDFVNGTAIGTWTAGDAEPLDQDAIAQLFAGELYINIHTTANGSGEIRAQIRPSSGTALVAQLDPDQTNNGVVSDGSGTAVVQLTDVGAAFYVTVDGLTGEITNAHFHSGAFGQGGGPVRGVLADFDGSTAFGLWTPGDAEPLDAEQISALVQGNVYLNIHTAAFGPGEIRGQLLLASGWGFGASLDADQQTENVVSDGTGSAALTLTDAGLVYRVTVDSLSGEITNAHFHNAAAGEGGPVVRTLSFEGNTTSGLWSRNDAEPLTDDLVREILAGKIYVNIHTAANGSGEIRGQVLPNSGTSLSAELTTAQAAVEGDGSGTATFNLKGDEVEFEITVTGLTGDITVAHIHAGPAGNGGPPVRTLTDDFVGNTASGVWRSSDTEPLTAERIQALVDGGLYVNIHTVANGPGEVRGQIHLSAGTVLRASLTNEQEGSGITHEASGTAFVTLTDDGAFFSVTVTDLTGDITNAHIHAGAAGENGGPVRTILSDFDGNTASGFWTASDSEPLTDSLRNVLLAGGLYLNIHTVANGPGEIRGQIFGSDGIGSAVNLGAGQQPGNVTSDGQGAAAVTLTSEGLLMDMTVEGLTGEITNAHIHNAPLGENGGVARSLADEFDGSTIFSVWRDSDVEPLGATELDELLLGNMYFNVHTAANGSGEIRGQIIPNTSVVTAIESENVDGATFSRLQNYPNPFSRSTKISFTVESASVATLRVYNVIGQSVGVLVDRFLQVGTYDVSFDASDLPSGLYFYELQVGGVRGVHSMVVVR